TVQVATTNASFEHLTHDVVQVEPFTLAGIGAPRIATSDGPTQLEVLVDAIARAHEARGGTAPRRPRPDPVPYDVDEVSIAADGGAAWSVPLALADDPDHQARHPFAWRLDAGNLALIGIRGSGTTTALRTIVTMLAARHPPEDVHVYVVSFTGSELDDLRDLDHVGAVIGPSDVERRERLVRRLHRVIDERRDGAPRAAEDGPRIVVVVDGFDSSAGEAFARVIAEGGGAGIHVVTTASRIGA